VEQQWTEQFAGVLSASSRPDEEAEYRPRWYSGSSWSASRMGAFAGFVGSSLSSAISSSSTAPESRSGGRGGALRAAEAAAGPGSRCASRISDLRFTVFSAEIASAASCAIRGLTPRDATDTEEVSTMSERVLVILSCGTNNPNRATRALFFAMVAKKKGKDVSVFLLDEAVYLARPGIIDHLQAATGDSADDHLHFLQEYGVPLLVCTPCAVTRQIAEADLIKGARMAKGEELIDLASGSVVLSF
jgi:predicted peroxiredoxin